MAVEVAAARRLFTREEYHRMGDLIRGELVEMSPIVAVQGPIVLAADNLLIEAAESSLAYDRSTKRRLYAAAGIPECWVVDCAAESVEVHRTPDAGGYREVSHLAGAASVSPLAFPDLSVTLAEIFAQPAV